ncbi:MAG: LysR family transcriptional regulator [Lachnospiraceae bacterium]|nr:LysR family transcriptional regulator [Lachnospiraceae bacterium]
MDYSQIKVFNAVYATHSMTHAANTLFMTQPSVSRVIQHLECSCNGKLFLRKNRTMVPTPLADSLYSHTQHAEAALNEIQLFVQHLNNKTESRLGFTPSVDPSLFASALAEYRASDSEYTFALSSAPASELIRGLKEGFLDLALSEVQTQPLPDLEIIPLRDFSYRLVLPPKISHLYPELSLADVNAIYSCLLPTMYEKDTEYLQLIDSFSSSISQKLQWVDFHSLLSLIHDGIGFSVLPVPLIQTAEAAGYVSSLSIPGCKDKRTYCLYYHKGHPLSPASAYLLDLISSHLSPSEDE